MSLYDDTALIRDLLNYSFGERIARGQNREVYEWRPDPKLVAKVETGESRFQNVLEAEAWYRVKGTKLARWFAPVKAISPAGTLLLMPRTSPAKKGDFPKKVPAFFTDLKIENWGWLDGQLVCHDYGVTLLMERGMGSGLRVAKWWSEKE